MLLILSRRTALQACLLVVVLLCQSGLQAAPWIEAGDSRLRHHIQLLADAGLIRVPVNTWPLMWSGVISEVKRAKGQMPTPLQRRSIAAIEAAFERQSRPLQFSLSAMGSEQINPIRGFGDTRRDEQEAAVAGEFMTENWAGRLSVGWADDPLDGKQFRWDRSYLATLWGNWALTAGSLDRWWGPGWETGLILSNNARPVPGLSLQRNRSEPFGTPLLRWLGPWQLVMFAGQLEEDRVIADAKLLGGRFSFRPAPWLEFGVSRTAQWGGESRPEDLSSLKNLVLGKDNRGDSGIAEENEPGNQLGGIDWRFSFNGPVPVGFYGEVIGEDEADMAPSRRIFMMGLDVVLPLADSELRIILESADTAAQRVTGTARFNYAYEHAIYQSGYRHRGRALAASVDNDSRAHHLSLQWYADAHNSLNLKLSQFDLNTDGRGRVFSRGNSVAVGGSNGYAANLVYRYQGQRWRYQLGYYHYNDDLGLRGFDTGDDAIELGFEVSL